MLVQITEFIIERSTTTQAQQTETLAYNRYYHMFDEGELRLLVKQAAANLGIEERTDTSADQTCSDPGMSRTFLEFVRDDWERSNFYVELKLWTV